MNNTAATRILAEELWRYREGRDKAIDDGDLGMAKTLQHDIYEIEDALYKLGWYDEQTGGLKTLEKEEKNNE